MNFRRAKRTDFDAINALYRLCAEDPGTTWNDEYPTLREIEADYASGGLYILTDGAVLAGTAAIASENELDDFDVWRERSTPVRELARIAVAPDYRGNGYALFMVERLLDILRRDGTSCVRLLAAVGNSPAIRTYEKAGFLYRGTVEAWGERYLAMEKRMGE